jgi:hypothetical protein
MSKEEENIDFNVVEEDSEEQELTPDDFKGKTYLKNPQVGEEIEFVVEKIVNNKNVKGKTSEGVEFLNGLKPKEGKGEPFRHDMHTDKGVHTFRVWEVYLKLLGKGTGLLETYAKAHNNSYKGAHVKIKHNVDGSYASMKLDMLAKVLGKSVEEAKIAQEESKKAKKEHTLYEVTLLN